MTKDELMHEWINGSLLAIGGGTWGAYEWLKEVSEFCRVLLPIASLISFVLYIAFNWKKIKALLKRKK